MHSTVSESTRQRRVADAFRNADADSDGRLTQADLKVAWIDLFGYKPCKRELALILQAAAAAPADEAAPPAPGGVSLDVFHRLALVRMARLDPDGQLRHAFAALDWRGRNFVRLEDFRRAVRDLAPRLADFAVERAFGEVDSDSDGRVTYRDFEFAMKFEPDQ